MSFLVFQKFRAYSRIGLIVVVVLIALVGLFTFGLLRRTKFLTSRVRKSVSVDPDFLVRKLLDRQQDSRRHDEGVDVGCHQDCVLRHLR